jgi:hypothetical protein
MRRAYIVVGELEDGTIDVFYGVCHSIKRADELCLEAEADDFNPDRCYTWHEIIEEDD